MKLIKIKQGFLMSLLMLNLFNCTDDDEVKTVDVPFSADKVVINAGETVEFTVGYGADLSSIYSGLPNSDFEKSRIYNVELKGYSEDFLKKNILISRLPFMKEYNMAAPSLTEAPKNISFEDGTPIELYTGKLVPFDYSGVTDSKYLRFKLTGKADQTMVIKTDSLVLPAMLKYTNDSLIARRAFNTTANNEITYNFAAPDNFDKNTKEAHNMRFGFQFTIDGIDSYSFITPRFTMRELLEGQKLNLAFGTNTDKVFNNYIAKFVSDNPTANLKKGISQIKLTFNKDNLNLLDTADIKINVPDSMKYKGYIYMRDFKVGNIENMVKNFDTGTPVNYVYSGTTNKKSFKYSKPGKYKVVLVSTFIGRKKYKGDGYITNRADEILATEYDIKRTYKTIEIEVK
ncbi:MAG: hypothetical protein KA327_11860 [Pseudarcicella sp.]|nr:hypothetical protein [Pseudarcicella sp.]